MVTLIILTAVVICLLALLIAILYMRNEEVQVTDKATDLADILPIQTITQDAIINGNGDIRFLNVERDHGIVFLLFYLHGNTAHHEDNFVGTGCDVLV